MGWISQPRPPSFGGLRTFPSSSMTPTLGKRHCAWALRMHELKRKNWAGSLPSWDAASTSRSLDILLKPVTVSEYKRGLDSSDMIWKWQRYDMKMTMMMTRMTRMTLWVSSCRIWLLRTCHYWDHLSHGPRSDLSDWSFGFQNIFSVQ